MAHNRYVGISDPKTAFAKLRPYREELLRMKKGCRPTGSDYMILEAVIAALDTAAYHFTREPSFFALKPEQSRVGWAPE